MNFFLLIIFLIINICIIYYFKSIIYKIKKPIKLEILKINKKFTIIDFYVFKTSYGLGVDDKENIYVPDYESGLIYEINNTIQSKLPNGTEIKFWDGKTSERIYKELYEQI